jgi:hypothetical protein
VNYLFTRNLQRCKDGPPCLFYVVHFTVEKSVVFLSDFPEGLDMFFLARSENHYFPKSISIEARILFSLDFCHLWLILYSHLWLIIKVKTVLQVLPLVDYEVHDQ